MSSLIQSLVLWALVSIVVLAVAIAINAFIAECFYNIAYEKGFEERRYFWIPFIFGIIGYLLVIALPDRGCEITVQPNQK